ncbi:MAG: PadR family transcriptional regulator [Desulfobacterales bacterium]|nr:PadR family transcriptional regulator [Desulfobacterales bacterium]
MKTKPSSEYVLLGALMSGPRHGYEIMQFTEKALGATWFVGTSQLYALLKRLQQQGLVQSTLEHQDARPAKRIFTISPEGKDAFLKWLHEPTRHVRDFRIEFMAKLFFFYQLSLLGGKKLIDAQIELLKNVRLTIKQNHAAETDPYTRLVYGFKLATVELRMKWLSQKARPFMAQIRD